MNEKKKRFAVSEASELRCRAEEQLRTKEAKPTTAMPEVDVRALLHELRVRQIELEMQNEELRSGAARKRRPPASCRLLSMPWRTAFPCIVPITRSST